MLAETMAEVKAGRLDPKVANAVAYVGTALLRAYEADAASATNNPTKPYVPLIYRSLVPNRLKHDPTDVIDLETGKPVGPPAAEVQSALPAHVPSAPLTSVRLHHLMNRSR